MLAEVVLGKNGAVGMDQYLFNYASSINKEISGVERVEEQGIVMKRIPLDAQIKSLKDISRNPKAFRRNIKKMNDLYQKGDLHNLHRKAKRSLGKMRKPLLWDRNRIMSDRITDLITETSAFIAIGAGHLGGGKGVIRLLKQKGFQLSRVKD